MRIYAGVDGGGTYTRALAFGDDGVLLGEGRSGPANWQAVGVEGTAQAVREAVLAATGGRTPHGVGACLAGVDLPEDEERLGGPLRVALGCAVEVENDIVAALYAVREDPCGVVSSGTGAAVGVRRGQVTERLLALNDYTGPSGGAGDIVAHALRAAILAAQGAAPETALSKLIPQAFGLADHVGLARATESGGMPPWQVALIVAPLCAQAAAAGDEVAARILRERGRSLGEIGGRYLSAHGVAPGGAVALHGSLLREGPPAYREGFEEGIRLHLPTARLSAQGLSALRGAALFAAARFGVPRAAILADGEE